MVQRSLFILTLLFTLEAASSRQNDEVPLTATIPHSTFRSLLQRSVHDARRDVDVSNILPPEGTLYGPCTAKGCCNEGACYGGADEHVGELLLCILKEDADSVLQEGYGIYPVECGSRQSQDLRGSPRDTYRTGRDSYRRDHQFDVQQDRNSRYEDQYTQDNRRGYDRGTRDNHNVYEYQDRYTQDRREHDRRAWDRNTMYEDQYGQNRFTQDRRENDGRAWDRDTMYEDRYRQGDRMDRDVSGRGVQLEQFSTRAAGTLAEHAKCGPGIGCCQARNRAGEALVCGYEHQWYSQCLTPRQCMSDPEKKKFNCKDVDVCGLITGGTSTTQTPTPTPKSSPRPSPRPTSPRPNPTPTPNPGPTPGSSNAGTLPEHAKCGPGIGCCQARNRAGEALVCGYEHQWYSQCLTPRQCMGDPEKKKFNCRDVDVCGLVKRDWAHDEGEGGVYGDRSDGADAHRYHG